MDLYSRVFCLPIGTVGPLILGRMPNRSYSEVLHPPLNM